MNSEETNKATGSYPYFSSLWHLEAMGIDKKMYSEVQRYQANGRAHTKTKVALIDNSVAWEHPNLRNSIDKGLMIDFFSARYGAFPTRAKKEGSESGLDTPFRDFELVGRAKALDVCQIVDKKMLDSESGNSYTGLKESATNTLELLVKRLQLPTVDQSKIESATRASFSAHGTAMAGLIGARPAISKLASPDVTLGVEDAISEALADRTQVLPYVGVDPFCSIIPISTSFDPDPHQFITAILYALLVGADVIVLARDFPHPTNARVSPGKGAPNQSEKNLLSAVEVVPTKESGDKLWDLLELVLVEASKHTAIICASGNGADNRPIYPASLSDSGNGIIAVGARTANGNVAGYSPSENFVDIFAPSGDSERLDRENQRLDTRSPHFDQDIHGLDDSQHFRSDHKRTAFSVEDLVTTDVPGKYGYNGDPDSLENVQDAIVDFGSYFCQFSGTSGASAVAAGFLSLAYSLKKLDSQGGNRGVAAKMALVNASRLESSKIPDRTLHWNALPR